MERCTFWVNVQKPHQGERMRKNHGPYRSSVFRTRSARYHRIGAVEWEYIIGQNSPWKCHVTMVTGRIYSVSPVRTVGIRPKFSRLFWERRAQGAECSVLLETLTHFLLLIIAGATISRTEMSVY